MMDEKSRFAGNRRLLLALGVFELQVDARAVLPQPFETVVFAGFLVHDVDDEITVVEQRHWPSVRPSRERGWRLPALRYRSFSISSATASTWRSFERWR